MTEKRRMEKLSFAVPVFSQRPSPFLLCSDSFSFLLAIEALSRRRQLNMKRKIEWFFAVVSHRTHMLYVRFKNCTGMVCSRGYRICGTYGRKIFAMVRTVFRQLKNKSEMKKLHFYHLLTAQLIIMRKNL